jgi:hypothetical protein
MELEKIIEAKVRLFELFAPYFTNPEDLKKWCEKLFKDMRIP